MTQIRLIFKDFHIDYFSTNRRLTGIVQILSKRYFK